MMAIVEIDAFKTIKIFTELDQYCGMLIRVSDGNYSLIQNNMI